MNGILSEKLQKLAAECPAPLYVVGGAVRDFLSGLSAKRADVDLCAPMQAEQFVELAEKNGFTARAVYKNTGTVKLTDFQGEDYEFTSFRSDKYVRGVHRPVEIFFTDDVVKDAKRRDFKANAVYYEIKTGALVDPLGGVDDIKAKRLTTVDRPEKVFGEDGLRLMRLARQAGQTGFSPSNDCLQGAKTNAALIHDVSPERIFAELEACLSADEKYGVKNGHYTALRTLSSIGVLKELFPALALGEGMSQRPDFHDYDVLEHSLRAVLYAPKPVRLAALFHDVGKPTCMLRDGHAHDHPAEGAAIARAYLTALKAPKKQTQEVCELVLKHMYDFDCKTKESKLKRFFLENADLLDDLLLLKQADFSACKDDLSPCPTGKKWKKLLSDMKAAGAPLKLKELKINGKDLVALGFEKQKIASVLNELLLEAALNPVQNDEQRLLRLAKRRMNADTGTSCK